MTGSARRLSQTALTAAAARAAHLIVDDQPLIFSDHLAATLLGEQADDLISYHCLHGGHVVLAGARGQVTCRSRYTEDQLARAAREGPTQYVILGASLDTLASRSPLAGSLGVFEADHPATQDRKRRQLAAAGLPEPASVTYVPIDLAELVTDYMPNYPSWPPRSSAEAPAGLSVTTARGGLHASGRQRTRRLMRGSV